jgi:SAM-dependent methyltransferase
MKSRKGGSIFDRSGLVAVSDFETAEWRQSFRLLELEQLNFSRHEDEFRSPEYRWPRKPLNSFSRCYEYPYVYFQLCSMREAWSGKNNPAVLDYGSGVTFFPFAVAKLGFDVTCIDVDPLISTDIPRAARIVSSDPGSVLAKLSDGYSIPFADSSADVVYCISVLEHIPWFSQVIEEVSRVLRAGGLFILTHDVLLEGINGLNVAEENQLQETLGRCFVPKSSDSTVHPLDVLDVFGGPFPGLPSGWKFVAYRAKQWIKPLIGRKRNPINNMAVKCCSVLKRL